VFSKS